jgi:hypothetical protein
VPDLIVRHQYYNINLFIDTIGSLCQNGVMPVIYSLTFKPFIYFKKGYFVNKQVDTLLQKAKNKLFGVKPLVFNFEEIFDAWVKGKCTTNYLKEYCNKQVSVAFYNELDKRRTLR